MKMPTCLRLYLSITVLATSGIAQTSKNPAVMTTSNAAVLPAQPAVYSANLHRLFYIHDTDTIDRIAAILTAKFPDIIATRIGDDAILLTQIAPKVARGSNGVLEGELDDARRLISSADQPKAQVLLNLWSIQIKEDGEEKANGHLSAVSSAIEKIVAEYDAAANSSLLEGRRYLSEKAEKKKLDLALKDYVTMDTKLDLTNGNSSVPTAPCERHIVLKGKQLASCSNVPRHGDVYFKYGLGYADLFSRLTPNLMAILITLIAHDDPSDTAKKLINKMEGFDGGVSQTCGSDTYKRPAACSCIKQDQRLYKVQMNNYKSDDEPLVHYMALECTRQSLTELFHEQRAPVISSEFGQFRAALADFLYQYKLMWEYPHDYHAYLEPRAADKLDTAISPINQAFEEDMNVMNEQMEKQVQKKLKCRKYKHLKFTSSGRVAVQLLADSPTSVESQSLNDFQAQQAFSASDFLKAVQENEAQGGLAGTSILGTAANAIPTFAAANAAVATLGALVPRTNTIHIGKELNLNVTVHTLSGAYGAELNVEVEDLTNSAKESNANTKSSGTFIEAHGKIQTKVRIPSLRVFQVLTLNSEVSMRQEPWKPIDPFFQIPALGLIVKRPRNAAVRTYRSIVFVQAFLVPTATDIADSVEFKADRLVGEDTSLPDDHILVDMHLPGENGFYLRNCTDHYNKGLNRCLSSEYIDCSGKVVHDGDSCKPFYDAEKYK